MSRTVGEHEAETRGRCRRMSDTRLRALYAEAMRRVESSAGKSDGPLDEAEARAALDELQARGLED